MSAVSCPLLLLYPVWSSPSQKPLVSRYVTEKKFVLQLHETSLQRARRTFWTCEIQIWRQIRFRGGGRNISPDWVEHLDPNFLRVLHFLFTTVSALKFTVSNLLCHVGSGKKTCYVWKDIILVIWSSSIRNVLYRKLCSLRYSFVFTLRVHHSSHFFRCRVRARTDNFSGVERPRVSSNRP